MPSLARESPTSQGSQQRWLPFLGWMRHQPPVHRDAMAGLTGAVLVVPQEVADGLLAWPEPEVAACLTRASRRHNDPPHDNEITVQEATPMTRRPPHPEGTHRAKHIVYPYSVLIDARTVTDRYMAFFHAGLDRSTTSRVVDA